MSDEDFAPFEREYGRESKSTSDKTAVVMLGEILQSVENLRDIIADLQREIEEVGGVQDVEDPEERPELPAEEIETVEAEMPVLLEEAQAAQDLWYGCQDIEEHAVSMLQLCLKFKPPL